MQIVGGVPVLIPIGDDMPEKDLPTSLSVLKMIHVAAEIRHLTVGATGLVMVGGEVSLHDSVVAIALDEYVGDLVVGRSMALYGLDDGLAESAGSAFIKAVVDGGVLPITALEQVFVRSIKAATMAVDRLFDGGAMGEILLRRYVSGHIRTPVSRVTEGYG